MQDIAIYFTQEEYDNYRNGGLAIGYTTEQRNQLRKLQEIGFDVGLDTEPLNNMTKVRPIAVSEISWSENGVYVCRPCRPH